MKLFRRNLGNTRRLEAWEAAAIHKGLADLRFSMKTLLSLKVSPADLPMVRRVSAAYEDLGHSFSVLEQVGPEHVRVTVDRYQLVEVSGAPAERSNELREATGDLQVRLATAAIVESLFVVVRGVY